MACWRCCLPLEVNCRVQVYGLAEMDISRQLSYPRHPELVWGSGGLCYEHRADQQVPEAHGGERGGVGGGGLFGIFGNRLFGFSGALGCCEGKKGHASLTPPGLARSNRKREGLKKHQPLCGFPNPESLLGFWGTRDSTVVLPFKGNGVHVNVFFFSVGAGVGWKLGLPMHAPILQVAARWDGCESFPS